MLICPVKPFDASVVLWLAWLNEFKPDSPLFGSVTLGNDVRQLTGLCCYLFFGRGRQLQTAKKVPLGNQQAQ